MIQQTITIQKSEDPFDTQEVTVNLPKGCKILSNEPYVLEYMQKTQAMFTEMEESFVNEDTEGVCKGEIVTISRDSEGNPYQALCDVGSKFTAYIILSKESPEIVEQLKPGMIVDIKIKPKKNGEIVGSISEALEEVKRKEIMEAIGNKSIGFTARITELIHGGYWVDVAGIKTFMPGSLAGMNKLHDFESMIGKEVIVMPITYSRDKDTIVVSHREYLTTMVPTRIEELRENIKEQCTGFVTGTTPFGVFAQFNECLTGLIPKAELIESKEEFDTRDIKAGDEIRFWVKEIISNKKIILTQTGAPIDPWDEAKERYTPMSTAQGKVTKVTNYGAFIQLEKGISGLIHKTQLRDVTLTKGDFVDVKIKAVNASERKVSLSLV
tara:strand:+ start:1054 stop:2199 length:1146 start_codon:yes stop_codon:yes gene_type:complete